ncbi:MAG: Clp protease ClpS [Armatimonadetes bacterium CG_4_10_14_3_um_filter_66_18]|nr:ATP-dependent Clp protease adaptor ClpS [Armatimonadota bacterium]OIO95900.1 MAG: hypothetical protein AUJ96_25765 [Armatimonadetes bacterium CG2_30_66_41]PIU88029.1 MAG: Clp protease ClpS [Armatimonadetes bacterium CG06_land_8_20_14_3_00_66_21]PIX37339.1 MAG: Clp protease ClpS [Armatimonadetes bacterium CG_4_8_14_3_um_filter_66_20]PIY36767.1 MAG: Clp protease ClpS [Armatimonadetes bacterium CG_4_10_14_3_um_filter_66_18]PIZ29408.1 MAG: Clp protease ClpS [Armatimonadetes bacterium CG_4_10_14
MTTETLRKAEPTAGGVDTGNPWRVILYNDNWHTFEEVVLQVRKAARCSGEEALAITYWAHTIGRAVACAGSKPDCQRALGVLREISLQAELDEA